MTSCDPDATPFTLRVAVVWFDQERADADGEALAYIPKAPLTGALASTADGRDVEASDLSVQP